MVWITDKPDFSSGIRPFLAKFIVLIAVNCFTVMFMTTRPNPATAKLLCDLHTPWQHSE